MKTQAICDHRRESGLTGPMFIGIDTHALAEPALASAIEVFAANGVDIMIDDRGSYTPTPVISHAILSYNKGRTSGLADGVVITPSLRVILRSASSLEETRHRSVEAETVRLVYRLYLEGDGVSYAKFCFLMQMSTKLCRTLHRFAEGVMVTNGSLGGDDGRMAEAVGHSCQSIPKRFRAFRSIS
jgi:hypothetical protein